MFASGIFQLIFFPFFECGKVKVCKGFAKKGLTWNIISTNNAKAPLCDWVGDQFTNYLMAMLVLRTNVFVNTSIKWYGLFIFNICFKWVNCSIRQFLSVDYMYIKLVLITIYQKPHQLMETQT